MSLVGEIADQVTEIAMIIAINLKIISNCAIRNLAHCTGNEATAKAEKV